MKQALRVLHVVVNMNRGGAETLIMNLYRNMDHAKIQFDFLTFKEGIFDEEIRDLGGVIHRIPYVTDIGHKGFKNALETFFSNHSSYAIVHSHLDKMSGIIMWAAKKAAIPIRIAHSHNTESEGKRLQKIYKNYAGRNIAALVTHRYACSKAAAKWLFHRHAPNAQIVKNGIELAAFKYDPKKQKDVRNRHGIDTSKVVFGHVGRFNEQKNHHYLIDIFAAIRKKISGALLVLVGDGVLRQSVEKKVIEMGLEAEVLFLGVRADIPDILQAFDIFIFPSLHEGLPVTLIESQGADLPCMIADTITDEVDMGLGLVHRIPLQRIDQWVGTSERLVPEKRHRKSKLFALKNHGYDITVTAKQLQTTYLDYGGGG